MSFTVVTGPLWLMIVQLVLWVVFVVVVSVDIHRMNVERRRAKQQAIDDEIRLHGRTCP